MSDLVNYFYYYICFVSLEPIILRIEFSKESEDGVLSDQMKEELFNKYKFNQLLLCKLCKLCKLFFNTCLFSF